MRKLLYIALAAFGNKERDGVSNKIEEQCKAFEKNGYDVYNTGYIENDCFIFHVGKAMKLDTKLKSHKRFKMFKGLVSHLKSNAYEVCYIRYPYSDPYFLKLVKRLKQGNTRIYIEVATFPIHTNSVKNFKMKKFLLETSDTVTGWRLKRYVDKVFSIGNIATNIHGIKTENIKNGVDVERVHLKRHTETAELKLVAVSYMFPPHGYERIIRGLADYYQVSKEPKMKVLLYMAGEGPELSCWQLLCRQLRLEDKVTFMGAIRRQALDDVFDECDLAVGSLGLYKEDIFAASPLKTKEYMARGIPFIYAYDEIGLDESLPFVLKFPNDETNIDINKIVKYYSEIKDNYVELSQQMREYALRNYDWTQILQDVK